MMVQVNYREFLEQPDVQQNFDRLFKKKKEYYRQQYNSAGFDKEHTELLSIKMAIISTDLHFSDIHSQNLINKKQ